jgi:hypothetical protein
MSSSAPVTRQLSLPLLIVVGLSGSLLSAGCGASQRPRSIPRGAVRVVVGSRPVSRRLPGGFVGLSIEYPSSIGYAGRDPSRLNPVYLRLVRGLSPGQSPVLRFGGDTADWTWWPVPGMARPRGIRYALTRRWLAVTGATARALNARLILGINFEADRRRIARAEAQALLQAIGRGHIAGFELGNEPEAYSTLGWYYLHHTIPVLGRPPGYGLAAYLRDYASISSALPRGVPFIGPASGALEWLVGLRRFLASEPRVTAATFHRYPLHRCLTPRTSNAYPTITNLLRPVASSGPAASLAAAVAVAHARGIRLRADELNSVSCGGARGVSDTFAAALWILDTLFNLNRIGIDGVNIHTFRTGIYAPFAFAHRRGLWSAQVRPLYYGLLMFARAAPPGSRLLPTRTGGGSGLRVWTTRGPDGRIRVLVINDRRHRGAVTAINLSPRLAAATAPATVQRLLAPSVAATQGVTLAGQHFAPHTTTGELTGPSRFSRLTPVRGRYVLTVPPASAALLTAAPR